MKTNYSSYIESFQEYLAVDLNYSSKTVLTYVQCLKKYEQYLYSKNINFLNINSSLANSYKAYLISLNYEPKTSSLYLSAVRAFYAYLVEIKALNINPFANMKNPKVIKKLPNFLSESETNHMFDNINYEDDLEVRNSLIVEFLYATGLRVSELCMLKIEDLNTSNYTLRVMGKGSKERIVFYKACDFKLLNQYLTKSRPDILNGLTSPYLFVSKRGQNLTTRSVEKIVQDFSRKRGIKSKVTPHTMRHTYATGLLNNGADIRSVGELLGHESLSTTQIYTHVTSERLKSVYNKTHPRTKK